MEYQVAAKGTKPGNKSSMGASKTSSGKTARVPVGTLHYVDVDNQNHSGAMYDAICGETHLVSVDVEWDSKVSNERCSACEDAEWQARFAEEQRRLLT
jgi:hypothetical protein